MEQFKVRIKVTGYYTVNVNAEDVEEATKKAENMFETDCELGDLENANGDVYMIEGNGQTTYLW